MHTEWTPAEPWLTIVLVLGLNLTYLKHSKAMIVLVNIDRCVASTCFHFTAQRRTKGTKSESCVCSTQEHQRIKNLNTKLFSDLHADNFVI